MDTLGSKTAPLHAHIDIRLRKIRSLKTNALNAAPPKIVLAMAPAMAKRPAPAQRGAAKDS